MSVNVRVGVGVYMCVCVCAHVCVGGVQRALLSCYRVRPFPLLFHNSVSVILHNTSSFYTVSLAWHSMAWYATPTNNTSSFSRAADRFLIDACSVDTHRGRG